VMVARSDADHGFTFHDDRVRRQFLETLLGLSNLKRLRKRRRPGERDL